MRTSSEDRATQAGLVTGGEAVVRALEARGVEIVFGIPGTHSLPIYRHLTGSPIRHVLPRHEQGAAFAADGYARSTGRAGVCLVTTGPGVTNAATAAAQAYSDSIPIVIISPGMPKDVYRRDVGYVHEAKDQSQAMENLVAWSHRAESPADVVAAINRAFDEFATRRPRPVHIEIPLEVLDVQEHLVIEGGSPPSSRPPDAERIREAVALLQGARNPVLIVGGGAQGAADRITKLAHALDSVVFSTANGKGSFPENDDLSVGAVLCFRAGKDAVAESDVVVAIGTELGDSDLEGEAITTIGRVIRIDIDGGQLNKNLAADCAIESDATVAIDAILEGLTRKSQGSGARRADAIRSRLSADLEKKAEGVLDAALAIQRSLATDAIVVCDTSMLCWNAIIPSRFTATPRSCLNPTGYATLGYALPAGIGAKLAHPDRDVIVVIGDGGILFTIAELATAVDEKLTLPIVVTNNHGYGEIRHGMIARGIEPIGVTFDPPDFVLLAQAFGARGVRVENAGELERAARAAFKTTGPTVIEVVF
jgi:acetolactate synthase-1/2/3 large subunit